MTCLGFLRVVSSEIAMIWGFVTYTVVKINFRIRFIEVSTRQLAVLQCWGGVEGDARSLKKGRRIVGERR